LKQLSKDVSVRILSLFLLLLIASCAIGQRSEIEKEKKKISNITSTQEFYKQVIQTINNSQDLSQKQKSDFLNLYYDVGKRSKRLSVEIKKLKIILFRSLTRENNEFKIDEITRQIKSANNERLDLMFDALEKTKIILGKDAELLYKIEWFGTHHGS